ncbi:MAG: M42 family peptidase [Clostridia bacterium]|nr:M42 family peptidase [Clostridia bacterium]
MTQLIKSLCMIDGISGNEDNVREFITRQIKDYCEYHIDNLGNIIAFKKGKKRPQKKVMLDAHMDEVGLIITSINCEGFLKFQTVGGIETASLINRKVKINGQLFGVIGMKPVHLSKKEQAKKLPKVDELYIDIGAKTETDAKAVVSLGDTAVICSEFYETEDKILCKALDDRVGCAILIELIKSYNEYDFYAVFSTQEEVGLRGARVAAFSLMPQSAIILEGTTAADMAHMDREKTVCKLGCGAAVSFMDKATVYDREYYNAAFKSGIKCQPKAAVTGGNNSGAVHLTGEGIRTIALSVPCRYIHSASSVCDKADIDSALSLAEYMISYIASGEKQ